MIALAAAVAAAAILLVSLARLFVGPTLSDRALAASAVAIKSALACAAAATVAGRSEWIDVAFALVIGAIVLNVAMLKVFRLRGFQAPMHREDA